ncbi:GH92 family glycosyl hydrolase [bacterium]|nr:GH92 family glycosyl hydrolase [bacterium]
MNNRTSAAVAAAAVLVLLVSCGSRPQAYTSYVDPFIGTGGHGHTYPGASMPFGMVQLSPDTRLEGWDGCSGYHYSDSVIYGFSHTALSGTGIPDYSDILVMPGNGEPVLENGYGAPADSGYGSSFAKSDEYAAPGYYRVRLPDYGVTAELTATTRCGFHRYTFDSNRRASLLFDLKHRDTVLESKIAVVSDTEIEGFRRSTAWARDQHVYFVARFSRPVTQTAIAADDRIVPGAISASGTNIKAVFSFANDPAEPLLVKVGISAVSVEGARKNLDSEIPGWDFIAIRDSADAEWNRELSRIRVRGGSKVDRRKFYTALYHAFLVPNMYTDVDGRYRGMDMEIHEAADHRQYTVFSLWDTFRAEHPLFTIVQQDRTRDFIRTFLAQYEQGGLLPIWELAANYTGCMIGYHAIPVIVDAYMKGLSDFDVKTALTAMQKSADQDHLGLKEYRTYGYIPGDAESESVSKTLEYAYDDWCIAAMAAALGETETYRRFIRRAQFYRNVYDPVSGFMRGKQNGAWHIPFDPAEVNFYFTEANSWQYSFFVPQDIAGMIELMGGVEKTAARLDSLFAADSRTTGRRQSDITGLIGQYAHGNEPSHHMAYLYNAVGQPWKTQELVRRIMADLYSDRPDGLAGNEDCGQMSAWLVMSAMGLYQVTPGVPSYALGSPLFDEIEIVLETGPRFSIRAEKNSPGNVYIQSALLNGEAYGKNYITHDDIMAGGTLVLRMGAQPNRDWGSGPDDRFMTSIDDFPVLTSPWVSEGRRTFFKSQRVALAAGDPEAEIYYTLDGSDPERHGKRYTGPFDIDDTTLLKAVARKQGVPPSYPLIAEFSRIPKDRSVTILSTYDSQYTGGGDLALIDFIRGGSDFRNQLWQGYQGQDFDAIVDLGSVQSVRYLAAGFLQDARSWIWLPKAVHFSISEDGKEYRQVSTVVNTLPLDRYGVIPREFSVTIEPVPARYVRVRAENFGKVPDWHAGAGGKSWIFIDEITIE